MKSIGKATFAMLAALLLVGAMASSAMALEPWEEFEVVPNPGPSTHAEKFSGSSWVKFEPAWGDISCRVLLYGEFTGPRELLASEQYSECSGGIKPSFTTNTLRGVIGGNDTEQAILKLEGDGTSVFAPEFRTDIPTPIYGSIMGYVGPIRKKTSTLTLTYALTEKREQSPRKFAYADEKANNLEWESELLPVVGSIELKMAPEAPEIEFKKVKT